MILHPKAKRSQPPRPWATSLPQIGLPETSTMLPRALLCPCGMDPFPGVDSDFGEEKRSGTTGIPVSSKSKLEVLVSASLLGPPLVIPKEMRNSLSTRINRPLEGLVCMNFCSEENLDLPGNCNVVASDLYVTFV